MSSTKNGQSWDIIQHKDYVFTFVIAPNLILLAMQQKRLWWICAQRWRQLRSYYLLLSVCSGASNSCCSDMVRFLKSRCQKRKRSDIRPAQKMKKKRSRIQEPKKLPDRRSLSEPLDLKFAFGTIHSKLKTFLTSKKMKRRDEIWDEQKIRLF